MVKKAVQERELERIWQEMLDGKRPLEIHYNIDNFNCEMKDIDQDHIGSFISTYTKSGKWITRRAKE